jgi:hypothetical protein
MEVGNQILGSGSPWVLLGDGFDAVLERQLLDILVEKLIEPCRVKSTINAFGVVNYSEQRERSKRDKRGSIYSMIFKQTRLECTPKANTNTT